MNKTVKGIAVYAAIALLFLTFALAGCSSHPNEEQLSQLENSNQAAISAEKELEAKKAEKADLEKQLELKQNKLEECKAEKKVVSERLENM